MTLDEKYFELRLYEIYHNYEWQKDIKILHQIAKDAFEAGAEAQRVADYNEIFKEFCKMGTFKGWKNNLKKAINSATVKWEVPSE